MNRKDFRPSNSSSSITDKDRNVIRNHGSNKMTRTMRNDNSYSETYSETIRGKKVYFVDIIDGNKIKTLPESKSKEQADGKLKAYNNGNYNKDVHVKGDSDVGMNGYNAKIIEEYDNTYVVKDKDGNIDEVYKNQVITQEERNYNNKYYEKERDYSKEYAGEGQDKYIGKKKR